MLIEFFKIIEINSEMLNEHFEFGSDTNTYNTID